MALTFFTLPCSYEGVMRYARSNAPTHAKGAVLLLPGWGEWIEKYADVIAAWNARGFDVVMAEWRGQGLSSRFSMDAKKAWIPSFDLLVDDLDRLFKTELKDAASVFICAHSMGAHLGLRWFLERGRKYSAIRGVILMSQLHAFKTQFLPYCVAKILVQMAAWVGFGEAYMFGQNTFEQTAIAFADNVLTQDEARYQAIIQQLKDRPELKVGGLTFGWIAAMLQSIARLEKDLSRGAPRIPYLMLGSDNDPLVETSAYLQVASMLPHCQVKTFSGAKHEVLFETDTIRNAAWQTVDGFVEAAQI